MLHYVRELGTARSNTGGILGAERIEVRTILLVDDDPAAIRPPARLFDRQGWRVLEAHDGKAAYPLFQAQNPDVVIVDLHLPGIGGMDLLEIFRRDDPDVGVIILTGKADLELAVEAIHRGAENFLAKPVKPSHLAAIAERTHEKVSLRRQNRVLTGRKTHQRTIDPWSESTAMRPILAQLDMISRTDSSVLIQGETGTGKGWLVQKMHEESKRARQPFVEINCGGLTATFLDSELFGHEKGAFTDAKAQKRGLFEIADGGTIFLDEIGELAPDLQPKLLKVLETKKFRRLGGTREITIDVRLVAATNRDLAREVRTGGFREDLYYRLAVFPIHLPPLRERSSRDITTLCYFLLEGLAERFGRNERAHISEKALELLCRHPWPGNIRELRNVLERCLLNTGSEMEIRPEHLPSEIIARAVPAGRGEDYEPTLTLEEVERRHIARVLKHCEGNRARAAAVLGISRRAIYDKITRLGISEEKR